MPGPNRINLLSLFCSCVGHAAILGGLMYGLSDDRRERTGVKQPSAPLVVELIPLDRINDAGSSSASAQPLEDARLDTSSAGEGRAHDPVKPAVAAVTLVAKPVGKMMDSVSLPESGAERSASKAPQFSEYQRRLYEALARGSRYPSEARRLRLSGVTQLAFQLDRGGRVLDSWIQESSGSEMLDNAALEALERAQPLPPIPVGLPSRMDFVIEIDLSIMQQLVSQSSG